MSDDAGEAAIRVAFVCVQNAGRSQMSTAFAERERDERGLTDAVEILTGGTHPAEAVHEEVITVMDEEGVDLSDRVPREISTAELAACDYVATMGCSTLELNAGTDESDGDGGDGERGVEVRDWALADPDGEDLDAVREIREEIRERVHSLFEEIEAKCAAAPNRHE